MASWKALQIIVSLALLLVFSFFRPSKGCWVSENPNATVDHSDSNLHLHTVSHYAFFNGNPKWPESKYNLTYRYLAGFPSDFMPAVKRAFETWANATRFRFEEVPNNGGASDLKIGIEKGAHGDDLNFDGPGGTTAHAFGPPSGILHFDGDDMYRFSVDAPLGSDKVDVESLSLHEIGHLLGLDHSTIEEAVMFPTLYLGVRKTRLARDDLDGIKKLYGF